MATETQRIIAGSMELADLPASKVADTRGQVCPFPSFETAKLAGSAKEGEILEILSDDEYAATNSIPTILKIKKFEYAVVLSDDGNYSIKARKVS